jgi:hypothetical protein
MNKIVHGVQPVKDGDMADTFLYDAHEDGRNEEAAA